jgi:hypothetical protein
MITAKLYTGKMKEVPIIWYINDIVYDSVVQRDEFSSNELGDDYEIDTSKKETIFSNHQLDGVIHFA